MVELYMTHLHFRSTPRYFAPERRLLPALRRRTERRHRHLRPWWLFYITA